VYTPSILLYAPPKQGKTTMVMRALHPDYTGWLVTEAGALIVALDPTLNPWRTAAGKVAKPAWTRECLSQAKPFQELAAAVQELTAQILAGNLSAAVLDTLTSFFMREQTKVIEVEKEPEQWGRAAKTTARRLRSILYPLFEACTAANAPFVVIAHQADPSKPDQPFAPGGPAVPEKLVKEVSSLFSTVVRVETTTKGRVFKCNPADMRWVTGDRFNCVKDGEEADLAAVLSRMLDKIADAQ
jgi:hypothetical protein